MSQGVPGSRCQSLPRLCLNFFHSTPWWYSLSCAPLVMGSSFPVSAFALKGQPRRAGTKDNSTLSWDLAYRQW